jgi:hypothetical protein
VFQDYEVLAMCPHNKALLMMCYEFLVCLNRRMASKNGRIILPIDQCVACPKDVDSLKNAQVNFHCLCCRLWIKALLGQ